MSHINKHFAGCSRIKHVNHALTPMKIKGTVTYIDLEGGFWAIKGDDGKDYRPVKALPKKAQAEGTRIEADAEPAGGFSFFMWGTEVDIKKVKILSN